MSEKYALIIGNTEYTDPGLAQLTAPGKDAKDFARVLKDQDICSFDNVSILLNQPAFAVSEAIDEFLDEKKPDDLLVLYFSGHGVRDELGALYLAVRNTNRFRLRSTAIKSDFIRDAMDQSRSRRQVLILDCCNSGAFPHGTKAATGVSIGTASAFESGYGRIILTASDSTQFAWEGDKVIGETDNSLFTHYLVEGLKGDADNDGDGRITVDELYDYAYEKVRLATPKQTPSKFSSKQQGEIVLRQSTRAEDIRPVSLLPYLTFAIDNPDPDIRLGAVQSLAKLLSGKNIGLARSAKDALEKIATEDDSRRVSQAATQILESIRQVEQKAAEDRKAKEEAEHLAILKAEEERLARKKVEVERKAKEEVENLARAHASLREAVRLEAEREAAEKAAKEKAEKYEAAQKVEEERLAKAKIEADSLAEEEHAAKAKKIAEQPAVEKAEIERKVTQPVSRRTTKKAMEGTSTGLEAEGEVAHKKVQRDATKKYTTSVETGNIASHLINGGSDSIQLENATDKNIGRTPMKGEKIFLVEIGERHSFLKSLSLQSLHLHKIIVTTHRVIIWDKKDEANSFEISSEDLIGADFSKKKGPHLVIFLSEGKNFKIGLIKDSQWNKVVASIKMMPNKNNLTYS